MKRITDPTFRYVPSSQSTPERLRAKFRKIIAEQQKRNVVELPRKTNQRG